MLGSSQLAAGGNPAAGAFGIVAVVAIVLGGLCLYFLPWIIAARRHARSTGAVIVINIFLGWTFIGWVIALAMAFGEARSSGEARAANLRGPVYGCPNNPQCAHPAPTHRWKMRGLPFCTACPCGGAMMPKPLG